MREGDSHWWRPGKTWAVASDLTFAGEAVNSESAMSCIAAYACSKALGETVAGLPGVVFQMLKDQQKLEAYDSDAYDLLAVSPNDEMDSFTFWELATTRVVNAGNCFAEIQRDSRDRPMALWPIHPSRVRPLRDEDGSLYWEISSDYVGTPEYEDPTWRREHLRYLSNRNMLNVVGFGSTNGIIAPGVLPAANELAMDIAVRRYGGNFFASGASLTGVVEHPGFIDDPNKRKVFRDDLNQIHNNKTGQSIGVLWQGAKFQAVSISPEQAQFLQTRQFTIQQICSFYGVPPSIIGDYSESKFATADAMIRAFVMVTLRNLVTRMEKAINRQILKTRVSEGVLTRAFSKPYIFQIAIDGLLRGDPKTQAETFAIMRQGGALTADEWRGEVGFNPIGGDHGKWLTVPGGTTRLDQIDNQGTRLDQAQGAPQPAKPAEQKTAFNKKRLIKALEELAHERRTHESVAVDPSPVLFETLCELAIDALDRVHKITLTQIARWREQDPSEVANKLPDFVTKQASRLEEALRPGFKLSAKLDCSLLRLVSIYQQKLEQFDSYSIFNFNNHGIDVPSTIRN